MRRKDYNEASHILLELVKAKNLSFPIPLTPDSFTEAIHLSKIFILACYDPKQYFQYAVVSSALWQLSEENKECKYGWVDLGLYPNFFEHVKLEPAKNVPKSIIQMLRMETPPFIVIFVNGKVNLLLPCNLIILACKQCVYRRISLTIKEVKREVNSE